MSDRKKPGKDGPSQGKKDPDPTAGEVEIPSPIPSPFLRAGNQVGTDTKDTTGQAGTGGAAGQAGAATATTTTATKKKKGSNAQAPKRGRYRLSGSNVDICKPLDMNPDGTDVIKKKGMSRMASEPTKALEALEALEAPNAPSAIPKKPKARKAVTTRKATPPTRSHSASFPVTTYQSMSWMFDAEEDSPFDSDNAAYKKKEDNALGDDDLDLDADQDEDRSDHLQHRSDTEDDYPQRVRDFALDNEDDGEDEYLKHYPDEDALIYRPRT